MIIVTIAEIISMGLKNNNNYIHFGSISVTASAHATLHSSGNVDHGLELVPREPELAPQGV